MLLDGRILHPEDIGADVQRLHEELAILGFDIAVGERRRHLFGETTAGAVRFLQHTFPAELRELSWSREAGVVDVATAMLINRLVALRQTDTTPAPSHHVAGIVADRSGQRCAAATVTVSDQNVSGKTALGSATTDADGAFELTFNFPDDAPGETREATAPPRPDLLFEITDGRDGPRPVTGLTVATPSGELAVEPIAPGPDAPRILVNSAPQTRVQVFVDTAQGQRTPSELEQVQARLAAALQDTPYDEVHEGDGRYQVSFLTAETGVVRELIERLIAAARASRQCAQYGHGVSLAVFYGLAHAGFSGELAALAHLPRRSLIGGLHDAVEADIVPQRSAEQIAADIDAVLAAATQQALTTTDPGNPSGQDWLHIAGLSTEQQSLLYRRLADSDEPEDQIWEQLRDDPAFGGPEQVGRAQLVMRLAAFTDNNAALVNLLLHDEDAAITAPDDMARLDESTLRALVERAGLPASAADDTDDARATYVQRLLHDAALAWPTASVEATVARQHAELGVDPHAARWLRAASGAANAGGAPAFDLKTTHIDRYIDEHGERLNVELDDPARTRADLKRLQRTLIVADDPAHVAPLLLRGFDSALTVANIPAATFVAEHVDALGEATAAIHDRATRVNLAHLATHTAVIDAVTEVRAAMMSAGPPVTVADVVKIVPSYADLFGELSLCDCDDCESVLSPSAYLVDLLQFLSRSGKNAAGRTPLDVLLDRRPDIEHILLTCENSNTPMPAIDLVNQILETIVVVGKLDASAAHDVGTATAEELAANPQYTLEAARDTLMGAFYPIDLPYDLRLQTVRAFLSALGTSRYEVLNTLRQDALLNNPVLATAEAIAGEALALSKLDFELITGMLYGGASAPDGTLEDLYGLDAATLAPALGAGATGNAVRVLQQKLNADGAAPNLPITGVLDAATQAALSAFQAGIGLPAAGTANAATWAALDGVGPDMAPALISWVTEFLHRTQRPYTDLVALLLTHTVNPVAASIAALGHTKVTWSDVDALAASGFAAPNAAITAGAGALGLSVPEFVAWLQDRFDALAAGLVIESLDNDCDLDSARLRRVDGDTVSPDEFIAINRFLRLSARTGLSIADLDAVLTAFAGLGISGTTDANMPLSMAALLRLQKRLALSIPEMAVLLGDLPTGEQSLHTNLFLNRAALALDDSFTLTFDGTELAISDPIDNHIPALLAAFRVTADELALIRTDAGLAGAADTLSLRRLAALYRYPLLARALNIDVADVITMRALLADDPLEPVADQPLRLERLVAAIDALAAAQLSIAAVDQLLRHLARTGSGETTPEQLTDLAATLHDEQSDLAADIGAETGMPVERFRTLLGQLVGTEAVDRFLGITSGSATFTAAYAKTPSAAQIDAMAPNITFEPTGQLIRFARVAMPAGSVVTLGALTDVEKAALQAAAVGDPDLVDAIGVLHAAPRKSLADVLAGIPSGTAIAATILATGAGALDVEAKLAYLVEALLPYVREALARALIKQELLVFTGLEAPTLATVLEDTDIATAPGTAAVLISPLRDLEHGGWSAQFYTSTTLTGAPLAQADVESLDYADTADFGQPSAVGSARFSAHLLPRTPATIVFEVQTTGTPALFWNGETVPAVQTGQLWRFDARTVDARERVAVSLEWRRTAAGPTPLTLAWINGTDPRGPLPARLLAPESTLTRAVAALTRLDNAARLLRTTGLTPTLLAHAAANPAAFDGFTLDALPLSRDGAAAIDAAAPALLHGLLRLTELNRLNTRLRGEDALLSILSAGSVADATPVIAAALALPATDVALLLGPSGFNAAAPDIVDGEALQRITAAATLIRRVGIAAADLLDWATKPVDVAQTEDVKRATRARFDDADWLQLSGGLNDPLREAWRDALASWLIPRLHLTDRNQLFELLLMDIEVSSCMKSSPVLNAITAAQNFVLRVQLDLENLGATHPDTVVPTAIDAQIWQAKKYYRVQTAARTVFMYPENYMLELQRDNATPQFNRFVNDVGQADQSPQGIETAFLNYLKGVDEVARLEICGASAQGYDAGTGREVDLVHLIGRSTVGAPYSFFYRRLEEDQQWTPWERVPIDVDALHDGKVEGAHVIPVVWNRRLYVFWPILEVKPNPSAGQNPMAEPKAHKDWRKAHQAWETAHDQWQKNYAKWKADKDAWEAWKEAQGRSEFYPIYPPVEPVEPPEPDSTEAIRPQSTHMEIRIAWSEFFDGRWSAKEVSSLVLSSSNTHPEQYVFSAVSIYDGRLFVEFICRHLVVQWVPNAGPGGGLMKVENTSAEQSADRGTFEFNGINGRLKATSAVLGMMPGQTGDLWIVQPDNTLPVFNTFELRTGASGLTYNVGDYLPLNARLIPRPLMNARRSPLPVLTRSPSTYRVTPPHHYAQYVLQGPSFYTDFDRTYIVTREYGLHRGIFGKAFTSGIALAAAGVKIGDVVVSGLADRPIDSALAQQQRIFGPTATQNAPLALTAAAVSTQITVLPADKITGAAAPHTITAVDALTVNSPALRPGGSTQANLEVPYVLFRNLFHPHITEFIRRLNQNGVDALLATGTQQLSNDGGGNRFVAEYKPTGNVGTPYPLENVDFGDGAYAGYNWELFYHCPMLMADVFEAAGLFDDTERCLRYVLDPTAGDASGPTGGPAQFWQFLPFKGATPARIQDLLTALSYTGTNPVQLQLKAAATKQIQAWERDPFNPFLIGRLRPGAFQKHVLIRWVQHLILRADTLLRSDRPEPINEAVQVLVFAANLLGQRPERVPERTRRAPQTYATLKASLDRFANALVLLENEFPFAAPTPSGGASPGGGLLGMSEALYFCIPPNALLESLWDTIADRLFKIRHCMNIDGVVRELPLYEPPIDPALLVAARAQGLDLASVLADLGAPLPQQRFDVCLEQANQAVEDVRRLGQDLKSILDVRDTEDAALRRAEQDLDLLRDQVRQIKLREVDHAKAQIQSLEEAQHLLKTVRIPYYMRQLGLTEPSPNGVLADAQVLLSSSEQARIESLGNARSILAEASQYTMSAKMMSLIPTILSGSAGISSPVLEIYLGGHMLALGLEMFAQNKTNDAANATHQATLAEIRAAVERRAQDWSLALSTVVGEYARGEKDLVAARIALDLANFQLISHDKETEFAAARLDFLKNKDTALAHQDWLKQEVGLLLGQYYQLAFDLCKRAQQVYRFDTGDTSATFVEFGYFDKAHHGLLSGERMAFAMRKMARSYRDQEQYEYSLSKPVSMAQLDPLALVSLRATGSCEFSLPESLFDADFPGHYMRRIRSVSVTIPCVAGPYTTINATLTLLNSRIRRTSALSPAYAEQPDDPRFTYFQGVVRSIATSHAQDDTGLAPDRNRSRFDQFERFGAISRWRLELPLDTNAVDPLTITNPIIRIDYSAREGGALLADAARKANLAPPRKDQSQLFSLRHEFANEWHRGLRPADATATDAVFEVDLEAAHFPYLMRARQPRLTELTVMLQVDDIAAYQGGAPLQVEVTVTPLVNGVPGGAAVSQVVALQSVPTRLGGLPMSRLNVAAKVPARVQIKAASADVGLLDARFVENTGTGANLRHRFNGRTVRDLNLIATYDTQT